LHIQINTQHDEDQKKSSTIFGDAQRTRKNPIHVNRRFSIRTNAGNPIPTFLVTCKRNNCGEDELKVTVYSMKEAIVNEIVKSAKRTFQNVAFTVMMDLSAI
jgi:hypothetical protein